MSDATSHSEVKMGSDRSFGFVFFTVFIIIALWPYVFGHGLVRIWALIIASVFLVLALAAPTIMAPLNRLWFKFGLLLGAIMAPIAMGLIFVLTVIPIGYLRRIRNPDPINQRIDPTAETYWISRSKDGPQSSMYKQY